MLSNLYSCPTSTIIVDDEFKATQGMKILTQFLSDWTISANCSLLLTKSQLDRYQI
jgi:hypothetical protein